MCAYKRSCRHCLKIVKKQLENGKKIAQTDRPVLRSQKMTHSDVCL